MGNVKKCILVLTVILALGVVCSLSAFALTSSEGVYNDPNFEPLTIPSYNGPSSDGVVYYGKSLSDTQIGIAYHNMSGVYYLLVIDLPPNSNFNKDNFDFYLVTVPEGSNQLVVLCSRCKDASVTSFTSFFSASGYNIYRQDGSSANASGNTYGSGQFDTFVVHGYFTAWSDNFYAVCPVSNQYGGFANDFIQNGFSMTNRRCYYSSSRYFTTVASSYASYDLFYYCIPNSLGNGSYWTFTEAVNSGGGTASVISGSASGSMPDGQGGSQDVNFDINFELPEYDGEIGVGEYPTMPQFDDSALSVMDGGLALQWIYDKLQYFYTNQQKIALLLTSCLSLGVVMLILNKRS